MASPEELIDALRALGAIRARSPAERARIERQSASRELLRLECAHHLAGVVEMQVLMAAAAAADAIEEPAAEGSTRMLMAGWELFSGASADQDAVRVGLLAALAGPAERRDHADGRHAHALDRCWDAPGAVGSLRFG